MFDRQMTDVEGALGNGTVPRVGIWEAMRRHALRTLLPVVILVPIAVGLGLARSPRYTGEARLIVGRLDIGNPGLSGFVTATQSLASAYSRAVTAAGVTETVARELHMTPSQVSARVTGSPIQESPVFRVIATAKSSAQAIVLANATSVALTNYVSKLNQDNPDGPRLLRQYGQASQALNRADLELQAAQRAFRRSPTAGHASALSAASTAQASARLQMQTVAGSYQASEAGQATTSLVSTLNRATSASSDRSSVLELLVFIAVVVGLGIGAALATARANRVGRNGDPAAA